MATGDRLLFQDMREYARFQDGWDEDAYGNGDGTGGAANDPLLGPRRRGDGSGGVDSADQERPGGGGEDVDGGGGMGVPWRRAWRAIFKKGNDVESARVNHNFTPTERAKLANVESIDYLAPNSATYRKWLARQPHRRSWDRWLMMGSIGVATGLVAHFLYVLISFFAGFKYGVTRWLLGHTNVGVAWLFNVTVSVGLVAASSAATIGWAPEAQGSGVPEVMAYLNGCMLPKLFNVATLVVKFVSCGLAVASGLPVGPEGPLIHIGAAIGAALSQGHSTTMGFSTHLFRRFRNPKDKRDFVTAGVSVGVAAAFNAPIGGLLFAFEEVASFWQQQLGWQVFYACMCAVLTLNLSRSAGKALLGKGSFGWFDKEVAFEQIGMSFSSHVLAVAPAAVIGLAAGLLAIAFTVANIKVTRLRAMLTGHLKWKRAVEPCLLAAVYITGVMVLPLFFPCTPAECVIDERGEMQCSTGLSGPGQGIPEMAPSLPLYTCRVIEHSAGNVTAVPSAPFPPPGSPFQPPMVPLPSFPPPGAPAVPAPPAVSAPPAVPADAAAAAGDGGSGDGGGDGRRRSLLAAGFGAGGSGLLMGMPLGCGGPSYSFSNLGSSLGRSFGRVLLGSSSSGAVGDGGGGAGSGKGSGGGQAWLPKGLPSGGGGSITPNDDDEGFVNGTATVYYNQLATLLFSTGEEGIKHLFARGTHRLFGYRALAVMGAYYFVFAVLIAGSAVASGLFVPMLMIGAVLGRIIGLATVDIAQGLGKRWSVDTFGPWTWIDPGVFALVGAGAFMGGVTRMTVALAVIMIEVSSDVHMLLPVLVAIMVAKWVADAATHSLYHGLLEVKCVPFLPSEPVSAFSLDLLPVSYVMRSPVVCLRQRMTVREITDVLRRCKHNGFPVLRDGFPQTATNSHPGGPSHHPHSHSHIYAHHPSTNYHNQQQQQQQQQQPSAAAASGGGAGPAAAGGGSGAGTCCGLITRGHLMALLQKAVLAGRVDGLEVDWTELNRKMMDPVSAAKSVHAQQMAVLAREMAEPSGGDSGLAALGLLRAAAAANGGGRRGSGGGALAALGLGRRSGGGATMEPAGVAVPGVAAASPRFGGEGYDYGGVGLLPSVYSAEAEAARPGVAAAAEAAALAAAVPRGPDLRGPAVAARSSSAVNGGGAAGDARLTFGDEAAPPPTSTGASDGLAYGGGGGGAGRFGASSSIYARGGAGRGGGGGGEGLESSVIDLTPYINTSAFVVPDSFSVERTYVLFRTMGLRHLIVVDEAHTVKGMVTRKDLLGYRLDDAMARALNGPNGGGGGSNSSHHYTSSRAAAGSASAAAAGGTGAAASQLAGNGLGAAASLGQRVLAGRPGVTGGPSALHPTTAGMRNLLVSGNVVPRPLG